MGHAQQLRDLLAPLGVYRWEGTFQWGELQSQGAALDQVAEELEDTQQEMHLATAQGEGLDRILSLLGWERGEASVEDLRATAAALLRIGGGSFTLAAMNDTLRGCSLPARVEETGDPLKLKVIFPPRLRESPPGLPRSRPGWRTSCPATYRWSTSSGRQSDGHAPSPKGGWGVTMERDTSSGAQVTDRPQTLCNNLPVEVLTAEDGKTIMWMLPPKGGTR